MALTFETDFSFASPNHLCFQNGNIHGNLDFASMGYCIVSFVIHLKFRFKSLKS